MLQPLIKRLLQPVFNPRGRTGLLLDRNCVWIVGTDSGRDGTRLLRSGSIALDHKLFGDGSEAGAIAAAATAIAEFLRNADDGRYRSIRIALPDPAVNFSVFELDAMPKTRHEQDELARFLFKKELYLDMDKLSCISQDLGISGGKRLLLGVATNSAWIDGIKYNLHAAGIFPVSIGVSAVSILNGLPQAPDASASAAAVTLENDFWSLLLWDESRRPRFMRGYWRDKSNGGPDHELHTIVSETERLITSYVRTSSGRGIGKIYITGGDADIKPFAALLNDRLSGEAEYIDFSNRCSDAAHDLPACCYALCGDA